MEDFGLAVAELLVRSIIPVSLIAAATGLVLIVTALDGFARSGGNPVQPTLSAGQPRNQRRALTTLFLERAGVVLCACLAALGLIAIVVNAVKKNAPGNPWSVVLVALMILLAAPAIFWRTRWRQIAEGVAAIALAGGTFLTGFSVGALFVPLNVLLIWICLRHIIQIRKSPRDTVQLG